ncbi:MAG TPA: hypothetical protein ENK27_13080 [Desulfobulbus sp.]|nr:hypothetical protein [Desulfobulbus sp.]
MQYRMIVSRAMFDFTLSGRGRLKLRSVRFLDDSVVREKNDVLLLSENGGVQFFLKGSTPMSRLSGEQFRFVAAAARFFGHLPDQERMPVWLWADSLQMEPGRAAQPEAAMAC